MIETREVRKSYGTTQALDALTLTVNPGEVLGLLGPNGAGKTTTIHLLAGFLQPDSGSVIIDGNDVSPGHPCEKECAGRYHQAILHDFGIHIQIDLTGQSLPSHRRSPKRARTCHMLVMSEPLRALSQTCRHLSDHRPSVKC